MNTPNELKVGIVVVLAGTLFYLGIRFLNDLPIFGRASVYQTELVNSNGLVSGSIVAVNGVGVGSIEDVQPTFSGALISFSIDDDLVLTEGTTTSTGGFGFVSSTQLNLTLGPPDAPVYPPGSKIPASSQASVLSDLANRAPDVLSRVDTVLTGSSLAINAVRELLSGPEGHMQQTLMEIQNSAKAFQAVLMADGGSVQSVLRDIEELSHAIEAFTEDSLGGTATNIQRVLESLDTNLHLLRTTTNELNTLLSSINRGQGTLGKLATEDSLYLELKGASASLRRILETFENDPQEYLQHLKLVEIF